MLILCIGFAIAFLDQATKYAITQNFFPGRSITVIPGLFHLTYVRNTGAAWGIFGGFNGWLAVLSLVVLAVILRYRRAIAGDIPLHRAALGLMTGGIVGNLLDRVRLQYVVDFLDFHWRGRHFPSFNVADSAICVGVLIYVVLSFWTNREPASPGAGADRPAEGMAEKAL